jgi:hypothetical protein
MPIIRRLWEMSRPFLSKGFLYGYGYAGNWGDTKNMAAYNGSAEGVFIAHSI